MKYTPQTEARGENLAGRCPRAATTGGTSVEAPRAAGFHTTIFSWAGTMTAIQPLPPTVVPDPAIKPEPSTPYVMAPNRERGHKGVDAGQGTLLLGKVFLSAYLMESSIRVQEQSATEGGSRVPDCPP